MVSRPSGDFELTPSAVDALRIEIEARLNAHQYETWFRQLAIEVRAPDQILITAANRFSKAWIEKKFGETIRQAGRVALGVYPQLEVVLSDPGSPPVFPPTSAPSTAEPSQPLEGQPPAAPPAGFPASAPIGRDSTFANFVVGPANRLAHAAALGVAESPGRTYNPIFIHGGVGLGKTHLLQAIVHRLRELPGLRTTYLTSESFNNAYLRSIEQGEVADFRVWLRSTDVLVVDDVQFISAKERTQDEFFHTFNALTAEAKQVVLSSDCSPKEIPGLDDRLISRFKMGLVARIDPPGFETRVAIVARKARARGRVLPEEVSEYLAEHIASNVRELEGAIARLLSLAADQEAAGATANSPITLALARTVVRETASEDNIDGALAMAEIQKAVAHFYGIRTVDLISKRRARTVSLARQVCMWLARQLTPLSLSEIGACLGSRDHSTVVYAFKNVARKLLVNPRLKADLDLIRSRLVRKPIE